MDKLNQKLISAGFDAAQSKIILNSINKIITKSIEKSKKSLVSTNQQNEEYKTHFAHLRSEINLLEKNDFAILKQENEKLQKVSAHVDKLKSKMREDLLKLQAGVRLDMNLDKNRGRDEQNILHLKIKETEEKLDKEIVKLRAETEKVKRDTIQTIASLVGSVAFVFVVVVRFVIG